MKKLTITEWGNPILRQRTKRLNADGLSSPRFTKLIGDMFYTLKWVEGGGVGLAAPQVGISEQLVIIEIPTPSAKIAKLRPNLMPLPRTVIINPRITSVSKKLVSDWEGCLSFPRVRGLVPRYKTITVEWHDEDGVKHIETLTGFHARVFQHEIDHLDGVTIKSN